MEWITNPEIWTALLTLLFLEVVLGVDNVIFISILASKLPQDQQDRARKVGLLAAGGMRIVLLMFVGWIVTLKEELFEVFGLGFSGKDLILLAGNVMIFLAPGSEQQVLVNLARRLVPGGLLVSGFSLDGDSPAGDLTVTRYDALAAAAGLHLMHRWATWDRAPFNSGVSGDSADTSDYAVSVHRR